MFSTIALPIKNYLKLGFEILYPTCQRHDKEEAKYFVYSYNSVTRCDNLQASLVQSFSNLSNVLFSAL